MKHKNHSSSISLKDFSPKVWNGRGKRCVRESGRCFSGWEWSFVRALLWGREVGVNIYRWGSKTSRFWLFCTKTGWTGPKTGWTGFQNGWHSRMAEKSEQCKNRLNRFPPDWKPVECPAEPIFEYQLNQPENQLNQPENQLNQYFPESNFGQDRLKKVVLHTFTKD
jgi:hypothetical protein